ncbi:hypothetical protein D3C80_1879700 [compost metagenome]
MVAQRFGHDPETPGQLVQFRSGRDRQCDVEITLADVIRCLDQGFNRRSETPSKGMGGDEADDQHCQSHQPE